MKDKISTMVRVERNYYNVTDVVLHVRDDIVNCQMEMCISTSKENI